MSKTKLTLFIYIFCLSANALPKTATEFCDKLIAGAPAHHDARSLMHVRKALGITNGGLGDMARASTSKFQENGFINLLDSNPDLLKDESKIPVGAIFVLDKSMAPGCPVSEKMGHVPVKCGFDQLYWARGKSKKLSTFLMENPKCVKSVMYNPKWDVKAGRSSNPKAIETQK